MIRPTSAPATPGAVSSSDEPGLRGRRQLRRLDRLRPTLPTSSRAWGIVDVEDVAAPSTWREGFVTATSSPSAAARPAAPRWRRSLTRVQGEPATTSPTSRRRGRHAQVRDWYLDGPRSVPGGEAHHDERSPIHHTTASVPLIVFQEARRGVPGTGGDDRSARRQADPPPTCCSRAAHGFPRPRDCAGSRPAVSRQVFGFTPRAIEAVEGATASTGRALLRGPPGSADPPPEVERHHGDHGTSIRSTAVTGCAGSSMRPSRRPVAHGRSRPRGPRPVVHETEGARALAGSSGHPAGSDYGCVLVSEKIADGGSMRCAAGHDVDVQLGLSPRELVEAIVGAHALIRSATTVTAEVLTPVPISSGRPRRSASTTSTRHATTRRH